MSAGGTQQNGGAGEGRTNEGGSGRYLDGPTTFSDVILGFLTQLARRYLWSFPARQKAVAYLVLVVLLSIFAEIFPFPTEFYIVQKHNVFNRFGTKLGWFWTCLLLCPFMWLTSVLHHQSRLKAAFDQLRLLIATGAWYFWTNAFVNFEGRTGKCHGSLGLSRGNCYEGGGKWIPGFDISGHAFLLLYSLLLICEESSSFRHWPAAPRVSVQHIPNRTEYDRFRQCTRFIQWNFVFLFVLTLVWDMQLVITALYYHNLWQKLIGASIAVFCWAVTYRLWYVACFPFLPIRRHISTF